MKITDFGNYPSDKPLVISNKKSIDSIHTFLTQTWDHAPLSSTVTVKNKNSKMTMSPFWGAGLDIEWKNKTYSLQPIGAQEGLLFCVDQEGYHKIISYEQTKKLEDIINSFIEQEKIHIPTNVRITKE